MVSYKDNALALLSSVSINISSSRSPSPSRSRSPIDFERVNAQSLINRQGRKWSCMLCKKDHRLATCARYMGLSTHKRLEIIRKLRYCVNCLAISHNIKSCKSPRVCSVCNKRHHSTLHHNAPAKPVVREETPEKEQPLAINPPPPSPPMVRKHVVIPTVRLALIYSGIRRIVRGLINPSQPFTTISESIVKQCKLTQKLVDNKYMCTIHIGNVQNLNWMEEVQAMVTDVLPLRPYPHDLRISAPFDTLVLADPDFYISDEVHIVLAADIYPKIVADGIMAHETGAVVAQGSIFGWTLTGSVQG